MTRQATKSAYRCPHRDGVLRNLPGSWHVCDGIVVFLLVLVCVRARECACGHHTVLSASQAKGDSEACGGAPRVKLPFNIHFVLDRKIGIYDPAQATKKLGAEHSFLDHTCNGCCIYPAKRAAG